MWKDMIGGEETDEKHKSVLKRSGFVRIMFVERYQESSTFAPEIKNNRL